MPARHCGARTPSLFWRLSLKVAAMVPDIPREDLTGLFIADNIISVLVYPSAYLGSYAKSINAIDSCSPARRRLDGLKNGANPHMADERIRRQIAFLAAQMMYHRTETEYFTAKRKAARQLGVEYRHRPGDLPSNKDIREQIQAMV